MFSSRKNHELIGKKTFLLCKIPQIILDHVYCCSMVEDCIKPSNCGLWVIANVSIENQTIHVFREDSPELHVVTPVCRAFFTNIHRQLYLAST